MKSFYTFLTLVFLFHSVVPKAHSKEIKEWTFLVFLNGHNNLDSFGPLNINQMETVGSDSDLNIIVQWASVNNETTQRLYIEQDSDTKKITSPIVKELPRVDMGDYRSLVDFVAWAKTEYPARHYFIDVWNHGNGWIRDEAAAPIRAISSDDLSGNSISTVELGLAFDEIKQLIGHRVDIFGADACLMAMVEVMTEISDSVDTFVGSEEVEPGSGWPYHHFLKAWRKSKLKTGRQIATVLAQEYVRFYQSNEMRASDDVTLSVVDLTDFGALSESIGVLSGALRELADENKTLLKATVAKALYFEHPHYVDVGDLLRMVEALSVETDSGLDFDSLREDLNGVILHVAATEKYSLATGLSIWWPKTATEYEKHQAKYADLKFSRRGNWNQLLHELWR